MNSINHQHLTEEVNRYLQELFPINRSLTGEGNRQTLDILSKIVPLTITDYPSGKQVFDWTIPEEWVMRDGWIKDSSGQKVIDFKKNNLQVVGYSSPINTTLTYDELVPHLHYHQSLPEAIPYHTSYYHRNWGFCLSENDFKKFFQPGENYQVYIDAEFNKGSLTIGEILKKGTSKKEYIISTYFCHPSLANDNLSGTILTALLARELLKRKTTYSYRFIFAPETIGAITYCATHQRQLKNTLGGLLISCVAGQGNYGYKETFIGSHPIDRAIKLAFRDLALPFKHYPFEPQGSDERQYSSPGFRIPIASIHKSKYHEFPEYHTSLDNLDYIKAEYLVKTLEIYLRVIDTIDNNTTFTSRNPHCEPQLGRRGLYPTTGLTTNNTLDQAKDHELNAIRNILFFADRKHSLIDIAERSGIPVDYLLAAANTLETNSLIKRIV